MATLLKEMRDLVYRHRLKLPADLFLMIKALSTMEGVGLLLDPDFDMARKAAPFVYRLRLERLYPGRLFHEFLDGGQDWLRFLRHLPADLVEILNKVNRGRVRIGFEHRGLEDLIGQMDRSANRIASSFIISALIIGSTLILQVPVGPFLLGIPVFSLIGFIIAGILGLGLTLSILRSGKL
ncbi:MAG: hypothetical protein HY697_03420 [Deltaproteobacteria bacterium]|nr:hypothetical protein [Deltaproteobacteria bacterium]